MCLLPLSLCSWQNWQGQINAPLIWWSVTEESLMHHPLCLPRWSRIPFSFLQTALIYWVPVPLDLACEVDVEQCWGKKRLKALQLFSRCTIPGQKWFTVLHCIFPHLSLKPSDAHWGHYGFYLNGSLIIEASYADQPVKESDKKLLWKNSSLLIWNHTHAHRDRGPIVANDDSLIWTSSHSPESIQCLSQWETSHWQFFFIKMHITCWTAQGW